ncbi:hypothetical protein [Paenibacillus koleovorans]|uniref:hypothetical protein n=1 Tax=Paenibacillus koleovorans TaxID=121608 RepID=UPI000FD8FE25|nr:hypothetical protein [Paenibacillus koleovorans]
MLIQEIITEADILVPNEVTTADKVVVLNALNQDFFNIVKIPKIVRFNAVQGQAGYTLATDVREKNIDLVMVGLLKYRNLDNEVVNPTQNVFTFEDTDHELTLSPAPYQTGLQGIVRSHRIATTTFTTGGVGTQTPDAPTEYHWTFVPALASFLAYSQDDAGKGGNYETQYKAGWSVAAQNYQKEGGT